MNKVILLGNLGRDPELTYTTAGLAICKINVATNRKVKGETETEWHRCVAFDKRAETIGRYLSKGRQILLEGRLSTRTWEDKDGAKRQTTEIIIDNFELVSDRGGANPPAQQAEIEAPSTRNDTIIDLDEDGEVYI